MIVVFHHCGLSIISYMEFLYSWVTKLYICIAQLENLGLAIFEYHMLPQQIYCFRRRNEEQDLTVLQLFSEQNIPYLFH